MARRRYELTNKQWTIIEPLPPNKSRGVPPANFMAAIKLTWTRIWCAAKCV